MEPCPQLTRRLEDYLEAVLMLVTQRGAARVSDIAAATGVSKPSVTVSLRKLAGRGLVHYDPYQFVTLTPRGRSAARRIQGKHDALARFLTDVLCIDELTARDNACRMEHVVDDAVLERLARLAEFAAAGGGRWLTGFRRYCQAGAVKVPIADPASNWRGDQHVPQK
jgi:DtxR family Mn-dependent transcriptional regulator